MRAFIKKILIGVSATLLALVLTAVLYACGGGQGASSRVVVCDHNYQTTVVAPTCTDAGYTLHKCSKCGDSYRDGAVAALGHNPDEDWSPNATEHWHECKNGCGQRTNVGSHIFDEGVVESQATCERNGRIVYTCTTCGFERADVLPATGHQLSSSWQSNQDSHWHACANDSTERIDNALHSWDSGFVEKHATCQAAGTIVYTCTVCGKAIQREIPRTDHKKSAEWESDEYMHWHTCQTCGERFDTASHTLEELTYAKIDPTCTEPGVTVYQCTGCKAIIRTPIPALGHEWSSKWYSNKDSHWHKCVHEGCTEKHDFGAHHFDSGVVYRAATCTSNGLVEYTCADCGAKDYVTVAAIGHDIDTSHWESNENGHWHVCGHDCGGKLDYAVHDFDDEGECRECGYKKQE